MMKGDSGAKRFPTQSRNRPISDPRFDPTVIGVFTTETETETTHDRGTGHTG
jgi:hypothetical protein